MAVEDEHNSAEFTDGSFGTEASGTVADMPEGLYTYYSDQELNHNDPQSRIDDEQQRTGAPSARHLDDDHPDSYRNERRVTKEDLRVAGLEDHGYPDAVVTVERDQSPALATHDMLRPSEHRAVDAVGAVLRQVRKNVDARDKAGLGLGTDLAFVRAITLDEENRGADEADDDAGGPSTELAVISSGEVAVAQHDTNDERSKSGLLRRFSRQRDEPSVSVPTKAVRRERGLHYAVPSRTLSDDMLEVVRRAAKREYGGSDVEGQAAVDDAVQRREREWYAGYREQMRPDLPPQMRPVPLTKSQQERIRIRTLRKSGSEAIAAASVTQEVRLRAEQIYAWDRERDLEEDPTRMIPPKPQPEPLTRHEMDALYELEFQKLSSHDAAVGAVDAAVARRQAEIGLWEESARQSRVATQVAENILGDRDSNQITIERFRRLNAAQQTAIIDALTGLLTQQNYRVGGPDPSPETKLLANTLQEFMDEQDRVRTEPTGAAKQMVIEAQEAVTSSVPGYDPQERTAIIFCEDQVTATPLIVAYHSTCTQIFLVDGAYQNSTLIALRRQLPEGVRIITASPYLDASIRADMVIVDAHHVTADQAFTPLRMGGIVVVSGSLDTEDFRDEVTEMQSEGELPDIYMEVVPSGPLAVGTPAGQTPAAHAPFAQPGRIYHRVPVQNVAV